MGPEEVVSHLRAIAMGIEKAQEPSRVLVARALFRILLATDKTLSVAIRDAMGLEIGKLIPGEFGGEFYDTNPGGKGYKKGYVSFGLDPNTWESSGIIGGILFKMNYDPAQFSSEAPESAVPGADEFKHSKGSGAIVSLTVECGYYNKLVDGSYSDGKSLGSVDVMLNEKEGVESVEIKDPGTFRKGVSDLIQEIASNPPDYAQSEKRKQKNKSPTGSPKSLLNWLGQQQRSDVGKTELESLARSMAERKGQAYENVLDEVTKFFRGRGWAINPKS